MVRRRTSSNRIAAAIAAGTILALAAPLGAAGAPSGKDGIGDPYYPTAGNPGYDVGHYALDLSYTPSDDTLAGSAEITATAEKNLSSFNLDLDGLTVASVDVGGRPAAFSRSGGELTVTPQVKIKKGTTFVTTVVYSGVPVSLDGAGFLATDDGALVAGQPRVASSWFPVNDHPSDKATYSIQVTVPAGLEAISNGRLVSQTDVGGSSVWLWNVDDPMASYLATIDIGEFDVNAYAQDGIQYWDALDPDLFAPRVLPHTGAAFAYSGQADNSYKRLQRTFTVDAASPALSFWVDRGTEFGWDFAFVEVNRTGSDEWTTLPDEDGILVQDAGFAPCADLLDQHPFLAHYLTPAADGTCDTTGTTGAWWAATGASDGWEQWTFDLSAYAGDDVDVSITYVSDFVVQSDGVSVDDVTGPGGQGTTSFEDDGDVLDGWTVPGTPEDGPANANDWAVTTDGPPSLGDLIEASFARQPEILSALSSWFGDYPFAQAGGIVDDSAGLGFALETQTRPVYAKEFWAEGQNDGVVVHELAHQWFGDSVALERWADIWLNEGFATYAEWLWSEYEGGPAPQDYFDFYYTQITPDDPFWALEIGDPGPERLFDEAVYTRGAMTLQALRTTIGDDAFFELLPRWHESHEDGNATTKDFIALAEQVSGQNLKQFFTEWLYTDSRPEAAPAGSARMFGVERPVRIVTPDSSLRR